MPIVLTAEAAAIAASLTGPSCSAITAAGSPPATVQLHAFPPNALPVNRAQPSPQRAGSPASQRPPSAAPGTGPIWPGRTSLELRGRALRWASNDTDQPVTGSGVVGRFSQRPRLRHRVSEYSRQA
jgi:hypothetical protein